MAFEKLNLSRDQLASFLQDFEQIRQFEKLFSTVDTISTVTIDEIGISADGAFAAANEALAGVAVLNDLIAPLVVGPPPTGGTVTSVDASGGSTGLLFTGGPITTSGTLTLSGTLDVDSGGTGQTSYTNGQLLIGNTTGNTLTPATLTAGTNVTITDGPGSITINATDAFVGTVTSVSVVPANGFAGTVATATTTPAITMSTSITGVLKGNGTAISAAIAGTDYVAPGAYTTSGLTMATSRLLGRTTASTGAAEEISVAGGLTLSGGVLTGSSGTVTSVTGTAPVVSSGGSTPAISMPAATTSVNGYLTSTDWTTFNNKGSGSVTSVAALTLGTAGTDLSSTVANSTTTPVITLNVPTASAANRGALSAADWTTFNNKGSGTVVIIGQTFTGGLISVAGSPITTSGIFALTVAGTSGGIVYFSSASTWASSALLAANALMVGGGAGTAPATVTTGTGVVTALGVNVGTAGSFVVNGGALGTPSSGTVTNLTGTASININGTVGATTANTGAFTSLSYTTTLTGGTGIVNLGSGQLYKDASGNVGIGTTAPPQLLAVGNATDQFGAGISAAVTTAYFGSPSSGSGGIKRIAYNRATGNMDFIGGSVASPSTQMTIDSAGNVGIGTSAPEYRLQVVDGYTGIGAFNTPTLAPSSATGGAVFSWNRSVGNGETSITNPFNSAVSSFEFLQKTGASTANVLYQMASTSHIFYTSNTEKMRITSAGDVGIGTSSPASKLDIAAGDLRFSSTGQRVLGDMSNATIANRLAFQSSTVNGNTNVHIIPNGTSVIAGFKVESDSAITNGQTMAIDIVGGSDARISSNIRGAGTYVPLTFYTGGAERVRIDTSGNVGVGATANASAILDVQSTTKGFRLPNMTTVQKNAITSPAAGLMVFDTTLAKACVYSGAAWQTITSI